MFKIRIQIKLVRPGYKMETRSGFDQQNFDVKKIAKIIEQWDLKIWLFFQV